MRTTSDVVAQLERGPDVIDALIEAVPGKDLTRRPSPGRWSAHEHACHVAVMEPMWALRLTRILTEDHPEIISYEPSADDAPDRLLKMSLSAALRDLAIGRRTLVERLRALDADQWNRPATHTGHARYSAFLMSRHVALHDLLHAYRIEESVLGSNWPLER